MSVQIDTHNLNRQKSQLSMMDTQDVQSTLARRGNVLNFERETKLNEKQFLVSLFFN